MDSDDNIFDTVVHDVQNDVHSVLHWIDPHDFPDQRPDLTNTLQWATLSHPLDADAPSLTLDPFAHVRDVVGNPDQDMAYWHQQVTHDSCAIAGQQSVIEQLTGQHLDQNALIALAQAQGWYSDGTPLEDCANLIKAFNLNADEHNEGTVDEIADQLAQGHGVLVALREETLLNLDPQSPVGAAPTIPGQGSDHVVEVIGIDKTDPSNPIVILNDPWAPIGAGERVPLAVFEAAWQTSDNTIVNAWA